MSSRRTQDSSNDSKESGVSQMSDSLRALIVFTNKLSTELDSLRNQDVEQQLNLPDDSSPETILARVLSPESITSTSSSFAIFNQSHQHVAVAYRVIGFGQCGLVFERPGRGYVVKVAKPAYEEALWADFKAHFKVRQAFEQQQRQQQNSQPQCRVPKIFSYVPKSNDQWWGANSPFFTDIHESLPLPAMALITERILPLPKIARQSLIDKYCPPSLRSTVSANPTNRDSLARIYLGRRRPAQGLSPPNFTLRNYNLCLDQMLELNLPVKSFASAMGEALAIIHWSANVDAYDVEFVLGSEGDATYTRDVSRTLNLTTRQVTDMASHTDIEAMMAVNFKRRTTRMWVLDFNLCNMWEESAGWEDPDALVSHLVTAFFENDPYYPLPLMEVDIDRELWTIFSTAYLNTAAQTLTTLGKDVRLVNLPHKFVESCISREREALAKNLGHGHRELKG